MNAKPRTISFDDGFFPEFQGHVLIVGVVMQGSDIVENVISGKIQVDGDESTDLIITLVSSLPQTLNAVFLDGIAFGGFNVLDLEKIHKETGVPAISVTRNKPNLTEIKKALENVPNTTSKWKKIKSNGPPIPHEKVYFQCKGTSQEKAKHLITSCSKTSLPEGLRLAHLIASGITRSGGSG